MATLVISPELEADVRRLAQATGKAPEEAVADAVRSRLNAYALPPEPSERSSFEDHVAWIRANKPKVISDINEDQVLGYDEFGVPEQPYLGR